MMMAHQMGMAAHHPGMTPGHPMAAAQHPAATAHLAAQTPGAGMVPQVHPGVSTPGVPQVSQAAAMVAGGMQPPMGTAGPGMPVPNAHALSHLTPHPHHLMQQQQQQHHQQQQIAQNRKRFSLLALRQSIRLYTNLIISVQSRIILNFSNNSG